jgi:alpha-ketoglutarate-dependent taurine dioxygenase
VVENVRLDRLPDADLIGAVEDALERYGVLIFRDQTLTPEAQVAWSRSFGPLAVNRQEGTRVTGSPEVFVVGNTTDPPVTFTPRTADGELEWHADHMHLDVSARASLLYAKAVPSKGGDTLFACMYSAYDALTAEQQEAYGHLSVVHSASGLRSYLRAQGHPIDPEHPDDASELAVEAPLVRRHPRTRRPSLYFGNQISVGISGWSDADAKAFIRDLTDHACRQEFRYRHQWRVGDAVLWDNRRVLHAGTPYDLTTETRLMHRTTFDETEPI